MMLFARAWKLCLESCSSFFYIIILGTPKFLFHMHFFFLNFFHAVLPVQGSCHRPPQTWHTYMWEIGGDRWEQSPLILEENGNFVIQNWKSRRILTLKFVLTPWAAFIHRSRTVKGQKKLLRAQTFIGLWPVAHLHISRSSFSFIYGDINFWGLCKIWALKCIK